MTKRPLRTLCAALFLVLLATGLWHTVKPLPSGLAMSAPPRAASEVRFLRDITWVDDAGTRHMDQEIFDAAITLIHRAQERIVLDMFLFNDFAGGSANHRPLAEQITGALLAARAHHPSMPITVITDPFNTLYGGVDNRYIDTLRRAGIEVIITNLKPLRDSNPLWSSLWRLCCQWFGNSTDGWLANPVGDTPVSLRTWLALPNFKANHRKALVVNTGRQWTALVTSANPHDASSAHDNIALVFSGAAALDVLASEAAVAAMSGASPDWPTAPPAQPVTGTTVQVVTEAAIATAATELLAQAGDGDQVRLTMFYFSHRPLAQALIEAHQRGARVQVILDPNEDAFGRKKNGVPNRPLAADLVDAGIAVRWCDTHGEQCHSKVLQLDSVEGNSALLLGSANYTRRNLDNYNLETNVLLQSAASHPAQERARQLFSTQWHNTDGRRFTADYSRYQDDSLGHYLLYRLMEATGLSSF